MFSITQAASHNAAHLLRQAVLTLLALCAACNTPAQVREPAVSIAWSCWYNPPVHVTCTGGGARPGSKPFLHIPLLGVPSEMEGVERLARIVACHGQDSCEVRFGEPHTFVVELDRQLDPVLATVD